MVRKTKPVKSPKRAVSVKTRASSPAAKSTEALRRVISEALAYEEFAFTHDEDVGGADLVEWFADWRERAKKALSMR